jgi:hypothetical protein
MLRIFLLLLNAYLLVFIQSSVTSILLPNFLKPDLMLIWVAYLGAYASLTEGAFLTLFGALLYDVFSGSPFGLFLFVYLIIFFTIKLVAKFLIFGDSLRFQWMLVALSMIFQAFLLIAVPTALEFHDHFFLPEFAWILPQILITCAASWPFFSLWKKLQTLPQRESSELIL